MRFPDKFPQWLIDLYYMSETTPYGEVRVHRARHRTDVLEYSKDASITPKTNEDAFLDLQTLLNSLVASKFRGKVSFDVEFNEEGIIKLILIKNKEIKTYGSR